MNRARHTLVLTTAGTTVRAEGALPQLGLLRAAAGLPPGPVPPEAGPSGLDIDLAFDSSREPFGTPGLDLVTRGAWGDRHGRAVLRSAGGSGWSQAWRVTDDRLEVRSRWAPRPAEALAAAGLPSRARALRAQVLLHHPVLWWASAARDLAPLHVSVVDLGGTVALLAGPGGVGKSTLVSGALAHGAGGTSDNVAVTDGTTVWGLREPLRLDRSAATGPRAAHGRVEQSWPEWLPALRPTVVVVVRRRAAGAPGLREISGDEARRVLVAGTLAAGELMRFWPLCATLAEATGIGPALPRVESVAAALTDRLPCVELAIVDGAGSALHLLLSLRAEGAPAR